MLKKYGDPRMKAVLHVVNGEGWFYSENWGVFQKRNGRVFCYISPKLISGWKLQLYLTGTTGYCELEIQTRSATLKSTQFLFDLGNSWLERYSSGDLEEIHQNHFSISKAGGAWKRGDKAKEWLIL